MILLLVFQLVPDPQYLKWPGEFVDLQHHPFGFRRHPRPKVVNNIRFAVAFHETFIGRTRERRRLLKDISDTQVSAVCILGKPGIGKTRLAIEAVQDAKADVKWLITADSRMAVKQGLINLAVEMELSDSDPLIHDGDKLAYKLALEWLANAKGWILVLDNVQSFADLTDLLPPLHRGTIVATAARRFVCPAEVNRISLGPLGKREASELLQRLAHRGRRFWSSSAGLSFGWISGGPGAGSQSCICKQTRFRAFRATVSQTPDQSCGKSSIRDGAQVSHHWEGALAEAERISRE